MKTQLTIIILGLLVLSLVGSPAKAAILAMSDEAMVNQSSEIVVGTVVKQEYSIGSQGTPCTISTVAVEKALKGEPTKEVKVLTWGGPDPTTGLTLEVSTEPNLQVGEKVFLMLKDYPEMEREVVWRPTNLGQSVNKIDENNLVVERGIYLKELEKQIKELMK